MNSKTLSIAGFTIRLKAADEKLILIEESYLPFILTRKHISSDVIATSNKGIPEDLLQQTDLLFEAKNDQQKLFSIHDHSNSYRFIIYDQQAAGEVQQVALLDKDLSEWEFFSRQTDTKEEIFPLLYPMVPLVLYYLTLKSEAVMLHASGVFDGDKGRLFTGFSGAGKSTMAYLWQKAGAKIINDDMLIVRKEKGNYVMYNTPMPYVDIPKKAKLDSAYLIKHAQNNGIKKLSGASAVSRLMAFCVQHNYNALFIEHHLNFLSDLCNKIPVYETGFLPDLSIVDFIKTHAV